jgi:glycine/D-amino acid oxidase-like deaminating enzyme
LPDAGVQQRSGSARDLSDMFSPMAATANPCKLMRGLRRVAIEIGIRIYERTPMLSFMPGPMVTLHTPDGSPLVGKMVLAINAWMASHFPQFERTLVVVSSDMVITEKYPGLVTSNRLEG